MDRDRCQMRWDKARTERQQSSEIQRETDEGSDRGMDREVREVTSFFLFRSLLLVMLGEHGGHTRLLRGRSGIYHVSCHRRCRGECVVWESRFPGGVALLLCNSRTMSLCSGSNRCKGERIWMPPGDPGI